MVAEPAEEQKGGFFAKLKARVNRGTAWLKADLLGVGGRELDDELVEELESRLLMADVGVDATTWLLDEMKSGARRTPGVAAIELLRQTARGLMQTVEAPLAISPEHRPFVILAVGVNGTGKTTTVGKLQPQIEGTRPFGAARGRGYVPRRRRRAAAGVGQSARARKSSRNSPARTRRPSFTMRSSRRARAISTS